MNGRTWESQITNNLNSPPVLSRLLRPHHSQSCSLRVGVWCGPRGFLTLKQVSLACLRTHNIIDMQNGLLEVQLLRTVPSRSDLILLSAPPAPPYQTVCNLVQSWETFTHRPRRDLSTTVNTKGCDIK